MGCERGISVGIVGGICLREFIWFSKNKNGMMNIDGKLVSTNVNYSYSFILLIVSYQSYINLLMGYDP